MHVSIKTIFVDGIFDYTTKFYQFRVISFKNNKYILVALSLLKDKTVL